jgi:hypothetical protein
MPQVKLLGGMTIDALLNLQDQIDEILRKHRSEMQQHVRRIPFADQLVRFVHAGVVLVAEEARIALLRAARGPKVGIVRGAHMFKAVFPRSLDVEMSGMNMDWLCGVHQRMYRSTSEPSDSLREFNRGSMLNRCYRRSRLYRTGYTGRSHQR